MSDTIELTIDSKYEFVELVGSVTKSVADMLSIDEESANWIELAVRECVINAIKHGNQQSPQKAVDVRYDLDPGVMTVVVRDRGEGFDPATLPDPLDPANLLKPSGRGIFYMRTFMDEVDYSLHPEGGTIVRMVKRRAEPEDKGERDSDGQSDNQ